MCVCTERGSWKGALLELAVCMYMPTRCNSQTKANSPSAGKNCTKTKGSSSKETGRKTATCIGSLFWTRGLCVGTRLSTARLMYIRRFAPLVGTSFRWTSTRNLAMNPGPNTFWFVKLSQVFRPRHIYVYVAILAQDRVSYHCWHVADKRSLRIVQHGTNAF